MKEYLVGIVLAGVGLASLAVMTFTPPRDATQLALVFSPWLSQEEVLARIIDLDVRLVRNGVSASVLIVDFAHAPEIGPVLAERALFVADARAVGACFGGLQGTLGVSQ